MTIEPNIENVLDPERLAEVVQVVARVDDLTGDGMTVTCSECSTDLPDDVPCPTSEDGEHVPDMELTEPGEGEPQERSIDVVFSLWVPNDGYDYATDVSGRLGQVLSLITLHQQVSAATTRSGVKFSTGSGYDGETANPSQ